MILLWILCGPGLLVLGAYGCVAAFEELRPYWRRRRGP